MPARSLDKQRDTPELIGLIRNAPRRQKNLLDFLVIGILSNRVHSYVKSKCDYDKVSKEDNEQLIDFIYDIVTKCYDSKILN